MENGSNNPLMVQVPPKIRCFVCRRKIVGKDKYVILDIQLPVPSADPSTMRHFIAANWKCAFYCDDFCFKNFEAMTVQTGQLTPRNLLGPLYPYHVGQGVLRGAIKYEGGEWHVVKLQK